MSSNYQTPQSSCNIVNMNTKLNRLRNELIAVLNQREAVNAVRGDAMKTRRLSLQSLEDKVHIIEQTKVLPHEAKKELDQVYNSSPLTPGNRRPLQCIVIREAVLLATTRDLQRLTNAIELSQSMGDKVRISMICELTAIEDERLRLWVDFASLCSQCNYDWEEGNEIEVHRDTSASTAKIGTAWFYACQASQEACLLWQFFWCDD